MPWSISPKPEALPPLGRRWKLSRAKRTKQRQLAIYACLPPLSKCAKIGVPPRLRFQSIVRHMAAAFLQANVHAHRCAAHDARVRCDASRASGWGVGLAGPIIESMLV